MGFLSNALETLGKVGNVIDLPASSLRDVLTLQNMRPNRFILSRFQMT